MDERVNDLFNVCIYIGGFITADHKDLVDVDMLDNYWALGEEGLEIVRWSMYMIAWRLLVGNWTYEELLREQLLIHNIKRNLRDCQKVNRIRQCCEILLGLGFTDRFLHE